MALRLPRDLSAGDYALHLALLDPAQLERIAVGAAPLPPS